MTFIDFPIFTINEARKIVGSYAQFLSGNISSTKISMDLGISQEEVSFEKGFAIIRGEKVVIDDFRSIKEDFCYVVEEGELKKIGFFSDETKYYYKLFPTKDWPTMMFSSTPMHRYSKVSPKEDTHSKIKDVGQIHGKVLDTCCGLGYTAICSAEKASQVYTHERDENVVYLEAINPYSRKLFTDKKIVHVFGSIYDKISDYDDDFFDIVIHDPPTPKYSPELYSEEFYSELSRVLKKGGKLYHYAPAPHKTRGETFHLRIAKRLENCGFGKIEYKASSSGIIAIKEKYVEVEKRFDVWSDEDNEDYDLQ